MCLPYTVFKEKHWKLLFIKKLLMTQRCVINLTKGQLCKFKVICWTKSLFPLCVICCIHGNDYKLKFDIKIACDIYVKMSWLKHWSVLQVQCHERSIPYFLKEKYLTFDFFFLVGRGELFVSLLTEPSVGPVGALSPSPLSCNQNLPLISI